MEKTCSKCQTTFNCQNESRGCWCETIHLSPQTLTHFKETYANCLCPHCLEGFAEKSPAPTPEPLLGKGDNRF